ncbi:chaperone NapD [Reichenbachiella sp.]|uniref:chaperone NapD n=1 Tax=Reichenbachiella sp. TaxID=2184521 RepID=UPI003B5BFC26
MPISSFLAIPKQDQLTQLTDQIALFPECDALPSTNKDLLVVVTETKDNQAEETLLEKINALDCLEQLTMVSGFKDNN